MLVVQGYVGSTVGSIERIQLAAERVRWTRQVGHQVVVVVSAMPVDTDRLLGLAHEISEAPAAREVDMLLATGEMAAIALMAMALQELGCLAASFTPSQAGILTDAVHTQARIRRIATMRLRRALASGFVPVVSGSLGFVKETGDFTTLGRGGGDLVAVVLAGDLQADRCEIYTDVDKSSSSCTRGSQKIVNPQAIEFARAQRMCLFVKPFFIEGDETIIEG